MFRMVGCVKSEMKAMKHGLYNVIPVDLLSGITAEVRGLRMCPTVPLPIYISLACVCIIMHVHAALN